MKKERRKGEEAVVASRPVEDDTIGILRNSPPCLMVVAQVLVTFRTSDGSMVHRCEPVEVGSGQARALLEIVRRLSKDPTGSSMADEVKERELCSLLGHLQDMADKGVLQVVTKAEVEEMAAVRAARAAEGVKGGN